MSNGYRELMRRKLLEEIYDTLSPEDKRTFLHLTMQDKNYKEIMSALQQQKKDLDAIKKRNNWAVDYGSDLLANFTSAGLIWLGSKLFRK